MKSKIVTRFFCILLLLQLLYAPISAATAVRIHEIAYEGSGEGRCEGEDWIELLNPDSSDATVDLAGYVLHDDKGKDNKNAKTFGGGVILQPGEYLVLCREVDFDFGIGGDDTITLLDASNGTTVSKVSMPGTGADDETYIYVEDDDKYKYTTTPTPGAANIYTAPIPLGQKLAAQNAAGDDFFLVNDESGFLFRKVVDIDIVMDEESLAIINDHPTWKEWVDFDDLSVDSEDTNSIVSSAGRIRTKGQSSNILTACFGLTNVPFQVEFDTPFLGMETVYFRNHLGDQSYMRDHASHTMLKAFGLPYLRTRPARLSINGKYRGFYTIMEAPTQAYVMQRSFGEFDPSRTALYKMKIDAAECPFDPATVKAVVSATSSPPDPYYFERGDHRADPPVLTAENILEIGAYATCVNFFWDEIEKHKFDVIRGYAEYNETCGLAMIKMGQVDRDFGPQNTEDAMVSFLDSKFYNETVDNLSDSIDEDQWLKNFAVYAVMLNTDSPIENINNMYLATTEGGDNDWKIVQYDHNFITTKTTIVSAACGHRMIYWPILRPYSGATENHKILGRVLNDRESIQKYLDYVQQFVDVLTNNNLLDKMRTYGNDIKEYIVDDPYNFLETEEYEATELEEGSENYNTDIPPFLKAMEARMEQVQKQLDAINDGSLPRDGIYGADEVCPDWRDPSGEDYVNEDYVSGTTIGESCAIESCKEAAPCYNNDPSSCSPNGELLIEECKNTSPSCDSCFPFSYCGTAERTIDDSSLFIESTACSSEFDACKAATLCFDHKSGICAYDGEILTVECEPALNFCQPCYPNSRCSSLSTSLSDAPVEAPIQTPIQTPKSDAPVEAPTQTPIQTPESPTDSDNETPTEATIQTPDSPTNSTSTAGRACMMSACATVLWTAVFSWALCV